MPELTLTIPSSTANLTPEPLVSYPPRNLLTPLPTPGHFLLVIDNSSLEKFTTCPMSAYYGLVLKREAHARNAALTFGGAIHEGLELFLRDQFNSQDTSGGFSATPEQQNQAIIRFFTENPAPLDEYRTLTNALAVLEAYRQRAALPDYSWEIMWDNDGPIIERAFELPLGVIEVGDWIEMPWLSLDEINKLDGKCFPVDGYFRAKVFVSHIHVAWSGRIDAVARCGDPRMTRICDHKTGRVDPQEYAISNPVIGYVWAGQQMWPELDIGGFCLNALATKKPAAGCSMTSVGPRGGKPALEMFRSYFEYSPARLEQWQSNCMAIVSDFVHCLFRNQFPLHTKACLGKYGTCQYHDVCRQDDPAVRQNIIQSGMFKDVTWNPVAGR